MLGKTDEMRKHAILSPDLWRSRPFDELPFAADFMWTRTLFTKTWNR